MDNKKILKILNIILVFILFIYMAINLDFEENKLIISIMLSMVIMWIIFVYFGSGLILSLLDYIRYIKENILDRKRNTIIKGRVIRVEVGNVNFNVETRGNLKTIFKYIPKEDGLKYNYYSVIIFSLVDTKGKKYILKSHKIMGKVCLKKDELIDVKVQETKIRNFKVIEELICKDIEDKCNEI